MVRNPIRCPVEVRTLGHFAVFVDGAPLRFGRKTPARPLALLKYLAASGGEVADLHAATALWPAMRPSSLASLSVNVHRLRRLLDHPAALLYQDRRLALGEGVVWCDALAFDRELDEAQSTTKEADRIRHYRCALSLYAGDFLLFEDASPWALAARTRLRGRFLRACSVLGHRYSAAARWEDARACYQRGLEVDELAEDLCLGLMRAVAALKRPLDGVAAFRRLERSLAEGPGVQPALATRALYKRLLEQEC
jgi:LuxR family transcriptional regulator, maltose regulon positive regulatory protein